MNRFRDSFLEASRNRLTCGHFALCIALALTIGLPQLTNAETLGTSWRVTGTMQHARRLHTGTLLRNGKVLVVGGLDGLAGVYGATNTAEIYDPDSGSWRPTGSLSVARARHTATLLANGQVLVVGGIHDGSSPSVAVTDTAEIYDPVSETWSRTGKLNWARAAHTATLLPSGKVLIAGGMADAFQILGTAEVYDPVAGLWAATGNLSLRRWDQAATLLPNGKVLVAGGSIGDYPTVSTAELYDPATGTWKTTGNLNSRGFSTATLLPGGNVLTTSFVAELYEPATESSTQFDKTQAFREQGYTATLLPTGKVLIAGGYNYVDFVGTESYDPATANWTSTGALNTGRYGHTATLLPNGAVLVAGGAQEGSNLVHLNSAEVFDAAASSLGVNFDPVAVDAETGFYAAFSGASVDDQTWLDVRFQGPGGSTDEVVLNWQRGSSALHSVGHGTTPGTYTVTGIRTHTDKDDHTGAFTALRATLTVLGQ